MSVETCAIHLNNLLLRQCLPVVAEQDGRIVAEMELFLGREGPRYGKNCHIGLLFVHHDYMGCGIGNKLVDHAVRMAKEHDCDTLTVASDENHENFYRRCGFSFGRCDGIRRSVSRAAPAGDRQPAPAGIRAVVHLGHGNAAGPGTELGPAPILIWRKTFAIPSYGEIVKRTDFLEINGSPALIAHVRHASGNTMVGAWSRDVKHGATSWTPR